MSLFINIQEGEDQLPEVTSDKGRLLWISSVDHKQLGIMYLWLALFFFIIGGLEAMLIRAQLAVGDNDLISPEFYNQLFTMHGTTMIFLVLMPALIGLATYLIPLMIGANEMAFPRLNAFSFWMTCLGGFLMYFSFFAGGAPDAGWFNYAPLSESNYSSTQGVDYYLVGLILTGMGSIGAGLNFVTTILTLRSPDIKLNMLPLFAWMIFINGFLILAAFPLLNAGLFMMLIDRQFDAHFFIPSSGGSAILWQHFFWSFGHPEVYILALPAFGIISEVIPVFSRNKIFGYKFVAASTVAIALLAFGVWVHHMFAVGMTNTVNGFFAASSMLIGIPTGVKVINWIGTLYKGSIRMTVSMMFAVAFLIDFTIGGLSGASFAIVPIDWQLTDTYYVVAHIHYVFLGGTAFGIFAGIYYWFPKISGRFLSEKLGKWHLWLFVIGFNFTFLVQHVLGILGMPRRIYTYPSRFGSWEIFNMISTLGAVMMFVAIAVFLWNLFITLKKPRTAPKNPWEAWTLEWATNSPPDLKNFEEVPRVHSRRPLWDLANPDNPDKRLN
ncbi:MULTISPECIES: cytochrome c oxidase subunit I [Flavobacteriaceae]|jgi:cytochrome c oxidase subunit 1/cytochrome c oxidase subunit I+III|uniref:Cytochrome c oxidase subunit 1 n=3 Tax=Flavobacteriaceae TaxID=49546 RepID=D5BK58_ZUNPS|nr:MULTISPECIES: cytochrome c oxidase subunit I [Flavobacteriaceae]MAC63847.1 cytochrome c oxidase subunit I [Flavobacteriaceae bacterium]MAO37934.1 cytochrome c oxidase subunit I [Zunongwangia sp.]MAQ41408.1 cytochrome c oxidase subunit I [Mesonia sp.]ADF51738.1 cytochrome c oxidase, subunit I [Zunongwangia profunda SM-A87]MBJ98501.1 cytochrome c oxidase subunit I [Flavobacteriaceae bacterium]|tara:strand:+ start:188 stop:1846 length:1659 start_codon:yes stop_codon:yes gene_type:complete